MNRTFITLSTAILLSLSASTVFASAGDYHMDVYSPNDVNIKNQAAQQRQQELQNSIRYQQQQSTLNNINRNLEYQNIDTNASRYNNSYSNRGYGYSNHF